MSPAVFGHGHLRLYLLHVLDERPMHGYEIIQALKDRFGGTYVPSAGTIYPRLAKLEAEGLVAKEADGRKTVYALTDAGRQELHDRREELDGIEAGLGDSVRRLADEVRSSVSEAMATLRAELADAAREAREDLRPAADAARPGAAAATEVVAETVQDATASMRSTLTESRSEARAQLKRAEVLLAEFRQDARTELRAAVTRGAQLRATVDELESTLTEVRERLRAALR